MQHDRKFVNATLPFPAQGPAEYLKLENEPVFSPAIHLELGLPQSVTSLSQLGYEQEEINNCPSGFGISTAFRILSDEGLAVMRDVCLRMYDNRNASAGTGVNRLGSYIRGAGYRSEFIKDFCESVELAEHVSAIIGTPVARHSVPAVACGVNYAPDDIGRAVDSWHTDSVSFDIVMLLSDPAAIEGGQFQYFAGTKTQGQRLLGIDGEEGTDTELPGQQVVTVPFPAAGYGFLQQGNMIFHRACKLTRKAERITVIPSFVATPVTIDATNSVNMAGWEDPGIVPELARHEAWRAAARLQNLVENIKLSDQPGVLGAQIDEAIAPLTAFRQQLKEHKF